MITVSYGRIGKAIAALPSSVSASGMIASIRIMASPAPTASDLAELFDVSRPTVYRVLQRTTSADSTSAVS